MLSQPSYFARTLTLGPLLGLVLSLQGCGPKEVPPPPAPMTPAPPEPAKSVPVTAAPAAVPSAVPTPLPGPKVTAPSEAQPAGKTKSAGGVPAGASATPAPAAPAIQPPSPEPRPAAPAPVQPKSPISDPGGEVAVKPTKAGLSRVGTSSCKMCHRIQYTSWSESAHARRNPPLDCEGCHGAGSEYKAMATMKDPAKARAAGLVSPGPAFCTTCHQRNWSDNLLRKAHAHKT